MEIEVKQPSGVFVKAYVKAISSESLEVTYEGGWKPDETVSYDDCRAAIVKDGQTVNTNLKPNDQVEAYMKQPGTEFSAWQKAKVRDIKVCFLKLLNLSFENFFKILLIFLNFFFRACSQLWRAPKVLKITILFHSSAVVHLMLLCHCLTTSSSSIPSRCPKTYARTLQDRILFMI